MRILIWLVWNVNWPYFFLEMWRMPCNRMCARPSPENMCLIQDLSTLAFFNARMLGRRRVLYFLDIPQGLRLNDCWKQRLAQICRPTIFYQKRCNKKELSLQLIINIFQKIFIGISLLIFQCFLICLTFGHCWFFQLPREICVWYKTFPVSTCAFFNTQRGRDAKCPFKYLTFDISQFYFQEVSEHYMICLKIKAEICP